MNGVSNAFVSIFSKITSGLKFNLMLYDVKAEHMFGLNKGEVSDMDVPESIREMLDNPKMYCTYFSHNNTVMVLYFIRVALDKSSFVIVVQDNKKHSRINSLISGLLDYVYQSGAVVLDPSLFTENALELGNTEVQSEFGFMDIPLDTSTELDIEEAGAEKETGQDDKNIKEPVGQVQETPIETPAEMAALEANIADLQHQLQNVSDELSAKFNEELHELRLKVSTLEHDAQEKDSIIADNTKLIDNLIEKSADTEQQMIAEAEKNELLHQIETLNKNISDLQLSNNNDDSMAETPEALNESALRLSAVQADLDNAKLELENKDNIIKTLEQGNAGNQDASMMNEQQERFTALVSENTALSAKNKKMLILLEKVAEEKVKSKEKKNESNELEEKLQTTKNALSSAKQLLSDSEEKCKLLSHKTLINLEKLLDIVSKKTELNEKETNTTLELISREMESLKKNWIQ